MQIKNMTLISDVQNKLKIAWQYFQWILRTIQKDSWQGFVAEWIHQQCQLKEFHFASHKISLNSSDFKIVLEYMEMSEIDFIANCTPNTC